MALNVDGLWAGVHFDLMNSQKLPEFKLHCDRHFEHFAITPHVERMCSDLAMACSFLSMSGLGTGYDLVCFLLGRCVIMVASLC